MEIRLLVVYEVAEPLTTWRSGSSQQNFKLFDYNRILLVFRNLPSKLRVSFAPNS